MNTNTTTVFTVEENQVRHAGQVCYWRLSGSVDPDVLAAAWETAGLDANDLPVLPSPSTALNRAVKGLQRGRTLVRPLEGDGYAIVTEKAKGDELDYTPTLRVKLDAVSRLVFSPEDHPLVDTIKAAYVRALNEFDTKDIAPWLVKVLYRRCDALSLREGGGFYYVPPTRTEVWDAMKAAIRAASSHRLFKMPALSNHDALDAILDAIECEAQAEAEKMAKEVAEASAAGQGFSERMGKTRLDHCDAVEQKVARYEELLGMRLDGIRERLGELRVNLSAAMLTSAQAEAAE